MKNHILKKIAGLYLIQPVIIGISLAALVSSTSLNSCSSKRIAPVVPTDTIFTHKLSGGQTIEIQFRKGPAHNHPLMAIWVTDANDKYLETLFVAKSIAKGVFEHGDKSSGKWLPGEIRRSAALPVWSHSRNVKEADGLYIPTAQTPLPDTYTGATPQHDFVVVSTLDDITKSTFHVYFEINQSWDWNEYWTNNKFPNDEEYKTSCQPSLVYKVVIDPKTDIGQTKAMELIGHGHPSGKNGDIFTALETITSAKDITASIKVKFQ